MAANHVTFLLATFVFLAHFAESATDPADVLPLQNMFSAFNSPPQLTYWNSDLGDPCIESWKGITCKGDSVVSIVVPGLGLNGTMGYMLSNLMSLETLDMSHNNIHGPIPYQLPPNLTTLNLASNNFSGDLAYSISYMGYLKFLNVSHNYLSRLADDLFGNLVHLKTLDLSFNNFTGNLPTSLNSLSHISTIYVQHNHLSGTLNVLSGLPLTNLNVADNNFSGLIPRKISSIPKFIFHGNSFDNAPASVPQQHSPPPHSPPPHSSLLGGDNISHRAPPSQTPTSYDIPRSREGKKELKVGVFVCIIVGSILGPLVAVVALAFCVCESRRRRASPVAATVTRSVDTEKDTEVQEQQAENVAAEGDFKHPDEVKLTADSVHAKSESTNRRVKLSVTSFSLASLQTATNSFNKEFLIGEGSLGRVYKAEFSNGTVMAVKKIDNVTSSLQDEDYFLEAVSNMSRLRHRNIVTLAGYSAECGHRLLVYQYVGKWNLHDRLHSADCSRTLSWNARVRIALGTARALEYLHEVSLPSVVHRNFKSPNILLDEELNPHLSDCGLAALTPNTTQQMSAEMVGSFGYSAPEFAMSGIYTVKSDVYSFGVVMLELLTGRKPLDSSRVTSEQSLVRWASPLLHDVDALAGMIDPLLNGMYPAKSLSRLADIIALCVQPEPEFRPPMSEVVQALVRLMQRTSTVLCRSPHS